MVDHISRASPCCPRRWMVERTFAWIVRCRRLGHDYERLPARAETMVKWAIACTRCRAA
ncbi:MAG: transposase [Nitriliruptorales bacterium]|nr:transposase [Nitriliruptorales bacterium]